MTTYPITPVGRSCTSRCQRGERPPLGLWRILFLAGLCCAISTPTPPPTAQERTALRTIWQGESGGFVITWTTADIRAARVEQPHHAVFATASLAQEGFAAFRASLQASGHKAGPHHCVYERQFRLMSVVGPWLSFEDAVYAFCEGWAHPAVETRFTSIDLTKSGPVGYAPSAGLPPIDVDVAEPGKVASLTDLFPESTILQALLDDPVLKQAWAVGGASKLPRSLGELSQRLVDRPVEVGDCLFRFPRDFLTRFAFHHRAKDRVAVRLGLPPKVGPCRTQHAQLGLALAVPDALKTPLALATSGRGGFLMRDREKIAGNQAATVGFGIGKFAPH
ncbi:MAG TPA: hypothetical protein VNP04_17365 [Alphaproteobacteria bacterium]|nr:hypothetical protein [Alphaproteobacteria bacterium]